MQNLSLSERVLLAKTQVVLKYILTNPKHERVVSNPIQKD